MNEFSLKEGRLRGGILSAIGAAFGYLVVPVILFSFVYMALTQLASGADVSGLSTIEEMRNAALLLGLPIVVLVFFRGYYFKGTYSRLVFALVTTAFVAVWIWFVLHEGKFMISVEEASLGADVSAIVLLFIIAAIIGGLYYVAEYLSYRKEYLQKRSDGGQPPSEQTKEPSDEGKPTPQPEVVEAVEQEGQKEAEESNVSKDS